MQEADEWTVVRPKTRRSQRGQGSGPAAPDVSRTVPHLTAEEIQQDFNFFNARFKASDAAKTLQDTIKEFARDALNVDNDKPITKAISLGIGSFDPPDGSWQLKRRAHTQLAAMLHMVSLLEENTNSGQIKCIFQEPLFTLSDTAFLTAMGHEVVDSPVASDSVTAGTLFYGPHLYKEVYAMALKGEIPAVWVGTDWVVWDKTPSSSSKKQEEQLAAIKKMHETYRHVPFPDDKDNTIFYGTCMYLKYPEMAVASDNVKVKDDPNGTYDFHFEQEVTTVDAAGGYVKEEITDDCYIKKEGDVFIKKEFTDDDFFSQFGQGEDDVYIKQEPLSD